jgi:hypothetical protein
MNHTLHCSTTAQFGDHVAYVCINPLILCRLLNQLATQLANYQQRINHTLHCSTTAQFANHVAYVCINLLALCNMQASEPACILPEVRQLCISDSPAQLANHVIYVCIILLMH